MHVAGSFTTQAPLPPNATIVTPSSVSSYSFSDGLNTYASSDANSRLVVLILQTDGAGQLMQTAFSVELWQTGTSPHSVGDRHAFLTINGPLTGGDNNIPCQEVGAAPQTLVPDSCVSGTIDQSSSFGASGPDGTVLWVRSASQLTPAEIPAITLPALIALAALLVLLTGVVVAGRRPRA
jgi:hypothetical protein